VFIPKCRRSVLDRELRKYLGEMFRNLAQQKEYRIEEGHLPGDHVHMLISIFLVPKLYLGTSLSEATPLPSAAS
jgi:REP element-mobilizing transposase RayT